MSNRSGSGGSYRRSVLKTVGLGLLSAGFASPTQGREGPPCQPLPQCRKDETAGSPPPGPSVLYEPPATAPQFENTGRWEADPLLVSGTDAYVGGEYLYQDYVYDDHGADTANAPPDPAVSMKTTGDVVYPTDEATYHNNAADILEVRAAPTADGIAYRITLNTMTAPDVPGVAIGVDTSEEPGGTDPGDDWGYGIGSLGVAVDHVLVTWGVEREDGYRQRARLDGELLPDERVSVDVERNQIELEVPLEPGEETWRHYAVAGLVGPDPDPEEPRFKRIQDQPSAHQPGGAHGMDVPPVFNVAFRFDEPMGFANLDEETPERQLEDAQRSAGSRADPTEYGQWRDHTQAKALGNRDISGFHVDVDFGKLAAGTTDYNVPETGYLNRLYSTRHVLGAGTDGDRLLGPVQPYTVYVPESYDPEEPTPLTIELHGAYDSHNAVGARTPNKSRHVGEQRDAIVLAPLGRGVLLSYQDEGELDVFEALADAAARYNVDFDRITLMGHSMGGYGTLKLVSQYPDLFAKAFVTAAASGDNLLEFTDNFRHVPLLWWQGALDPLVQVSTALEYEQQLRDHGYRHELDVFPTYEHNTVHQRDQWQPAADFLEGSTLTRRPAHVTYRSPLFANEEFGLDPDGAYWVSGVEVADGADTGLVDARSHAADRAEPVPADYRGQGAEPDPHVKRGTRWREGLENPRPRNRLDLDLEGVAGVTAWVEEAHLDPTIPIELAVSTTDPVDVRLESSAGATTVEFDAGDSERTVELRGSD